MKQFIFIAFLFITSTAFAANGVFQEGYGVKSKGMGGVAIALPQESMIGAVNPAGFALLDNRVDLAFEYLKVHAISEVEGNSLPGANFKAHARNDVYIPEGGIALHYTPQLTLGASIFGRGALNSFGRNLGALNGTKKAYANDIIVYLTPCAAWQPVPCHTLGIGVNLCLSYFKINGLENLSPSIHPHHVSNNNFDWEPGIGLRLGWLWEATPTVNIGATYETPTYIHKYKKYKGLIPNSGDGSIPTNFGAGIGWRMHPQVLVGFDVMRILWSQEYLWGNRASAHPFGSKKGTGLGWKDQTVYKVGVSYDANDRLTLRAGYNAGTFQIPASQTLANLSIMLTSETQATFGLTYKVGCKQEINLCFIHAFKHTVHGKNSIPAGLGGGEANFSYTEDWGIIGYGIVF